MGKMFFLVLGKDKKNDSINDDDDPMINFEDVNRKESYLKK